MYQPNKDRYENMPYRNAGSSGLKLPEIQLGMWHNFSADSDMQNCRNMLFTAFDCGITLFDLANNYSNSTAENVVGEIIRKHLANYRDELLVTSKAGYIAWEGPYGTWGSKNP
ncbi:MAG: aldo/keto reductase [Bacilli bacterium]